MISAILETILTVLLILLKVTGIILLSALALILIVVLLVLFVPVRYRCRGSFDKKNGAKGEAGISWLLHIISVKLGFDGKNPSFCVRLFGIKIMDSSKTKKNDDIKNKKKSRDNAYEGGGKAGGAADGSDNIGGGDGGSNSTDGANGSSIDGGSRTVGSNSTDGANISGADGSNSTNGTNISGANGSNSIDGTNGSSTDGSAKGRSGAVKAKAEKFYKKICDIKFKFLQICDKIKNVNGVKESYVEFLTTEESTAAIREIRHRLFKILCHIRPTHIKADIAFGFPDPSVTGQVYGAICVILGRYGQAINITPHFVGVEKTFAEGRFRLKGRIRAAVVLIHLFKIYRNKRLKEFMTFVKGKGK